MFEWKDIQLKDYAHLYYANTISDIDRQVMTTLYQSIIGAKAVGLYLFLTMMSKQQVRLSHQTILSMLQYNMQDFFAARSALEGIGLLKTYRTADESKDKYVYALNAPVSPYTFFNDPVYCGLLLEHVGQQQFNQLKAQFIVSPLDLTEYTDISRNFGQVFGNQLQLYTDSEGVIGHEKAELPLEDKTFDWAFFHQLIVGTYITEQQITPDVKQAILTIHQLYGTSPMDMREYVLQAHSLATQSIQVDSLYAIAREYKPKTIVKKVTDSISDVSRMTDYPKEIQALIESCKRYAPAEFIRQIKEQKSQQLTNGSVYRVEDAELKVIEQLIRDNQIAPEVVNMLLYCVLVVANLESLSKAYAERVANSWIKENITSPEQAYDYVKSRMEKRAARQTNGAKRSRSVKVIKMSEEEKKALNDTYTPVASEEWESLFS